MDNLLGGMTAAERKVCEMAIGRVLGMMARPHQDGDEAEFARCAAVVKDAFAGRLRGEALLALAKPCED